MIDKVEMNEREKDLADLFYEEVLGYTLTDNQKRRRVNRDFNRRVQDIAKDERVNSVDVARVQVDDDSSHLVRFSLKEILGR